MGLLFDVTDRRHFDIQRVAEPADVSIFNCGWCEGDSYYADFCGLGFRYRPRRVLEIGVRYGYSGMAVCTGAHDAGAVEICYTGVDAMLLCQDSNEVARAKFAEFCPCVTTRFFHQNTLLSGLPAPLEEERFDYVLVDGDHSYAGAARDIQACWPLLAPGGLMVIDDLGMVDVLRAVEEHQAFLEFNSQPHVYQYHHNERQLAIFQKGADVVG